MRGPVSCAAVVVAVAVTGLVACGNSQPFESRTGDVVWEACGEIACATLSVPLDHDDPGGRRIDLALGRVRATGDREGVVLTNPGGPGGSGLELLEYADEVFSPDVRERFDIVSWDPRGVGESAPVECAVDLDDFLAVDHSPDSDAEVNDNVMAAEAFAAGCTDGSAALLPFVSSRSTVDDMDFIRDALGEAELTYVGFSYGTLLGALYAQEYPERVRAMVLDGAIDPSLSPVEIAEVQAVGFEQALQAFFDWCGGNDDCGFATGGDPRVAFDRVIAGIDAEPLPAEIDGEARTLGPGEADLGVAQALYFGREGWPTLAEALAVAAQGDGTPLLMLSDFYAGRETGGAYSNEMFAFYAIGCLDGPAPATVDEVQRLADDTATRAPTFGAPSFWLGLPCTYWPVPPDGVAAPVDAPGTPPIVVIGTTNDPATPLSGAKGLAAQLADGRLLVYEGEGHTAYGGRSDCIDDAVDEYLLTLTAPADGTRCS
jgi:pimeloyl-ACP methyl ester carboxylesterase